MSVMLERGGMDTFDTPLSLSMQVQPQQGQCYLDNPEDPWPSDLSYANISYSIPSTL